MLHLSHMAFNATVRSRQQGVALAIVVWFIAGMSLLVAGIVAQARVDTQMAQVHVARAKAVAAGDGAIQLMMVDLMTSRRSCRRFSRGQLPAGRDRGHRIDVACGGPDRYQPGAARSAVRALSAGGWIVGGAGAVAGRDCGRVAHRGGGESARSTPWRTCCECPGPAAPCLIQSGTLLWWRNRARGL